MSHQTRDRAGSRRTRGLTLVEVLVVITILSIILGMSVILLRNANRDLGVGAATAHVVSLLRAVHDHARAQSLPAWVVLDLKEHTIYTITEETSQMWHFEDDTGAFGMTAKVNGPVLAPGRVGMAYRFHKPNLTIDCGEVAEPPANGGFALEYWVFLDDSGRKSTVLCSIGKSVAISADASGRVAARVGDVDLRKGGVALPLRTWVHVQLIYDGRRARLYLNGVETEEREVSGVPLRQAPLIVGSKRDGFMGLIDEVRYSLVLRRDGYQLPRECEFELPPKTTAERGEFVIAFDHRGYLDARRHPAGVTFNIKSPVESRLIGVSAEGLVLW